MRRRRRRYASVRTRHHDVMTQLRPYQIDCRDRVQEAWLQGHRNVLLTLPTGGGKCLAKGTPVLMFDGSIRAVENVKYGDQIMGPDSSPRNVLSTCQGVEQMYRVTPVKGDSYVVNESHILSLKMTGGYDSSNRGRVINIGVLDYLTSSATFKHCAKGWRTGINFNKPLPENSLEPYMLGFWLGDGSSRGLSFTTGDMEIYVEIGQFAARHDLHVRYEYNSVGSMVLHLIERPGSKGWAGRTGGKCNGWLRQYGLIKNKHIPHEYKVASKPVRLEVLAGILDSDGSYAHKGYDLVLANEKLFDDVIFIARSLGLSCYKTSVKKTCANNGATGDYFRCSISGDVSEIPCRIARKKPEKRTQKKDNLVTGIQVSPSGIGEYFGFEIDGDRLFVLGDFTVTHNTVIFSDIIANNPGASVAIAHRQELVVQISLALARNGVRHRIVGPKAVAHTCTTQHLAELRRNYVDPGNRVAVAGVDTLVRMEPNAWAQSVSLIVCDESHHCLKKNKWGAAASMFPQARMLGVTATPCRADGNGLGRHADGLMDTMILGPTMRELINDGYLTEYRIFAPPSDLDLRDVPLSASGDFSPPKLAHAVHKSHIVGDVVQHYQRIAPGKLGVTFAVDVASAGEIAQAYRGAGVTAEVVSAKTPDSLRASILRRFRNREIMELVNVDLFGEGFDLPAIEVVSMARPTQSYGLYIQQFGRGMRTMEGKLNGIIIDHVGNVHRHGLPDAPRVWSLDRRERRTSATVEHVVPTRTCPQCTGVYERIFSACPYCGFAPEPAGRSLPEEVDGDLYELTPEALARLRGEIDASPAFHPDKIIQASLKARHRERHEAQAALREKMAIWGGQRTAHGDTVSMAQRRFYHTFGIDVGTAQTLGRKEAEELNRRIEL